MREGNLKKFMAVCDDYEIRRGGFTEDDLRRVILNIGEGFDGVCRQKHLPVWRWMQYLKLTSKDKKNG